MGAENDMIEARSLAKRYGDTAAVDGLSFRVEPGLVTGFLGAWVAGSVLAAHVLLRRRDA